MLILKPITPIVIYIIYTKTRFLPQNATKTLTLQYKKEAIRQTRGQTANVNEEVKQRLASAGVDELHVEMPGNTGLTLGNVGADDFSSDKVGANGVGLNIGRNNARPVVVNFFKGLEVGSIAAVLDLLVRDTTLLAQALKSRAMAAVGCDGIHWGSRAGAKEDH